MGFRIARSGIVFWFAYLLFTGCTKKADGLIGPEGPPGDAGSGANTSRSAITGFVRLTDQYAIPESGADAVQVSTKMGDSLIKVVSDASGKFTLPALKSGDYRILFQKQGYDSIGVNVAHSAGNQDKFIGIVDMVGTLTTHFQDQTLQLQHSQMTPGVKYLVITSDLTGPILTDYSRRYFSFYISTTPDVSDHQFIFQYDDNSNNEGTHQRITQIYIDGTSFGTTQMHAGDSLYVKTYLMPSAQLLTSWFDSNSYQNVPYPYKGDSIVKSFIWTN